MIATFGPLAEHFSAGLGDIEAVIAEPTTTLDAYLHAVERRSRGGFFYGMLLVPDPRARIAMIAAKGIAAKVPRNDDRMLAMKMLEDGNLLMNGKTVAELWNTVDPAAGRARKEFYALCDAVLVRSYAEATRLKTEMMRPRQIERVLVEPAVPAVRRWQAQRPQVTVVVWGPNLPFEYLAFHALALAEFIGEVVIVGGGGEPPPTPGTFVYAADPRVLDALERASVIVSAEPDDPGPAVAFARQGYGVVAPRSSGADEFIRGVVTFDPIASSQLWFAVAIAITQPAEALAAPPALPRQPLPPASPVPAEELPLVSVITPTYNRREVLVGVLECIAAQRYPNVEHVVVNDGGEDIADIVARFPRARLIEHPENRGGHQGSLTGMANARGDYFQLLADDDRIYPDHIERLVYAMIRSGKPAAHGNALIRYQEQRADGSWRTSGFNASTFNFSTTPFEAMVATPIAGQSILFHRRVLDEIGPMRGDSDLADQEMQLRLWTTYPVVWVDHVTCEWALRGKSNFSARADVSEEMRRIFEVLHPTPPDSPVLARYRAATLQNVKNRPPGYTFPPTFTFEPTPLGPAVQRP